MFYIYTKLIDAHGVKVIVDNLVLAFKRQGIECKIIDNLKDRHRGDIIIPYGVKEANELIDEGLDPIVAFTADAITLGYRNKIKYYVKIGHIFNYDFLYSIYGLLRYTPAEKRMIKNFDKCILVSKTDIEYMKDTYKSSTDKFIYVTNGVTVPLSIKHNESKQFRIGILATWYSKQIVNESKWFINKFFKKFIKEHKDVQLVLAGRGPLIKEFENLPNIIVLGEVQSLSTFFSNIDMIVTANPKGCGILNRVLDGFAHGVPVCGIPESFTGFPNSDDCRFTFSNYKEFCAIIEEILCNRELLKDKANKAYAYVIKNNNWTKIYDNLVIEILSTIGLRRSSHI